MPDVALSTMSGVQIMPQWLEALSVGDAVLLLTALSALTLIARKLYVWAGTIKDRTDDLLGESERPGVPARPGVMERLAALTATLGTVTTTLAEVSGHLAASTSRLEAHEAHADSVISEHSARLTDHEARIRALEHIPPTEET